MLQCTKQEIGLTFSKGDGCSHFTLCCKSNNFCWHYLPKWTSNRRLYCVLKIKSKNIFNILYAFYSLQIPMVKGIMMFLFITEFLVGVIGNLLVCLTVYRNKSMHSPVNYYIVNLGVCDFLVGAFVLPMKVSLDGLMIF